MENQAYKLQEFVAHSSDVNCLSIGKKTGSLFITGGEDHKVNLWTIGKSSSLLSLCGHTSSVESIAFDSTEVLVVSGASAGTIKLWDLEEGKIVRSVTGHRLNCTAVEFHPFGEFFASGSSDANLKLWDIRKKGCLHTYKGHTQGVSTIKFTPDGRWIVSGGADNVVKIWDLTAGKLLHEFKFHVGKISCIDFHPMEFLLATGSAGSADKTVKFWDLETFELIGSTGPEATGIRSMTFHPDGRTLFCGLDDCLKIFSWEPVKCHDAVDMGWSTLGDLSIRDEKLLACSYYRNSVEVWVSDISKLGSNVKPSTESLNNPCGYETTEIRNIYVDTSDSKKFSAEGVGSINAPKAVHRSDSFESCNRSTPKTVSESEPHEKSSKNATTRPFTQPAVASRSKAENAVNSRESANTTRIRPGMRNDPTYLQRSSSFGASNPATPRNLPESKLHEKANFRETSRPFTPPGFVPRSKTCSTVSSRRESMSTERTSYGMIQEQSQPSKLSNRKSGTKLSLAAESEAISIKASDSDCPEEPKFHFRFLTINEPTKISEENSDIRKEAEHFAKVPSPDLPLSSSHENSVEEKNCIQVTTSTKLVNGVLKVEPGRTRSLVQRWERREICPSSEALSANAVPDRIPATNTLSPTLEHEDQLPLSENMESGHITREREASGHIRRDREVSGHMGREREVLGCIGKESETSVSIEKERVIPEHIVKEREASPLIRKDREVSVHMGREREALGCIGKESETSIEKERVIPEHIVKEREASRHIKKGRESTRRIEKERETLKLVEKEREMSKLVEKDLEASRLIRKEREAARLIKKEREASELIEREREASRLIKKEKEAAELICKEREASDLIDKDTEAPSTSDEDVIEVLMQNHDVFLSDLRSRLTKLQVVRHFWLRNDIKGGINAVGKLPDHCVQVDVADVLLEKTEIVTLDLFTCLLPLFTGLLNSDIDRHTNVSLEMLLKFVAIFGPVIRSTISASPSVRVDLQADRRREICNQCFVQLQKIKQLLPSVIRRGGSLAKGARELNLVLQEL